MTNVVAVMFYFPHSDVNMNLVFSYLTTVLINGLLFLILINIYGSSPNCGKYCSVLLLF